MSPRRVLVWLVRSAKGDAAFAVDDHISAGALAAFALVRAGMALRGVLLCVRSGSWRFPVFVGRGVRVTNPRHLRLSAGVTIEDYCRLDCLGSTGIVLGRGCTLRRGVHIEVTSVLRELGVGLVLGDRVGVSEMTYIGAKGPVGIGDDTIIGPGCIIVAENHSFLDPSVPIRAQGSTRVGIEIGPDCWLGAGVRVLDGVHVGTHSVIGAGAVVLEDIRPCSIAVGVPAHTVRMREA